MRYPRATWRPVTNHGGSIDTWLGLVLHVETGTASPWSTFANPADGASSHFAVGNGVNGFGEGAVEQYVDTGTESWAQVAGNGSYLSVETEGKTGEALDADQIEALAQLYAWLHTVHGIPLVLSTAPGEPGFGWHGMGGDAWGGHFDCPGAPRIAQRQTILNRAAQILTSTTIEGVQIMGVCVAPTGAVICTGVDTNGHKHLLKGPVAVKGVTPVQGHYDDLDLSDQLGSEGDPLTFIG